MKLVVASPTTDSDSVWVFCVVPISCALQRAFSQLGGDTSKVTQ